MKKTIFLIIGFLFLNAAELKLSGTVISDDTKMISSRYMGFVKKANVQEGDL